MWSIEYEQARPGSRTAGVYKTDHEFIDDGAWHPFRAGSTARYRISRSTLHVIIPDEAAARELDQILALMGPITPLTSHDLGVIEVVISQRPDGFLVMGPSDFEHLPEGIVIPAMTESALLTAIRRLRLGDG